MLGRIMSISKHAAVIPLDELAELEVLGPQFVSTFRSTFPAQHISLKFHLIETHLIDMAKRFGTTGLFAEDGAESIHALIMGLERRFASVKGAQKDKSIVAALEMMQNEEAQRASIDRQERRARKPSGKPPAAKRARTAATTAPATTSATAPATAPIVTE